nr:PREDICTED: limbic system-associated membrane protein [Latimeria chalumnae]|eukprot:XP_014354045.1 PREDICTED: limbic system-associated membrane protein [Latimeria chalumnae]
MSLRIVMEATPSTSGHLHWSAGDALHNHLEDESLILAMNLRGSGQLRLRSTELEGDEEYLEIFGITREQSGKYECRAANEVAVADMKQVLVTVNYPPTITEWRGTETAVGRPGSLRCEALGVPTPEFEWYRDDERINSAQGIEIYNHGTTSILTVVNVTENHYGNYTCLATNKLGAMNASLYLYRPGTVRMEEGRSPTLSQSLWFLAASLTCLLFTC